MNWREKTLIRVLLIIAKIIAADNHTIMEELKNLSNHISQGPLVTIKEIEEGK